MHGFIYTLKMASPTRLSARRDNENCQVWQTAALLLQIWQTAAPCPRSGDLQSSGELRRGPGSFYMRPHLGIPCYYNIYVCWLWFRQEPAYLGH
jgi:hypothetical protein